MNPRTPGLGRHDLDKHQPIRTVREARTIARHWVDAEVQGGPGVIGAFLHGSITWRSDDELIPATSDVDLIVVLDVTTPPLKPGKRLIDGLILDVSFLDARELRPASDVLGRYHLAGSFRTPSILADPTGELASIHRCVSAGFYQRAWVVARAAHARAKALNGNRIDPGAPFHEQVISWVFPATITTHVLLTAGTRNPTVRTRLVAARQLLSRHDRLDMHERLLDLIGCRDLAAEDVRSMLDELAEVVDATSQNIRSSYAFASDISQAGRAVAIDGSLDLIDDNLHREAMFWIIVTWARCMAVLHNDAPGPLAQQYDPGFRGMLDRIGIDSTATLTRRSQRLPAIMPVVWSTAMDIVDRNPKVVHT